MSYSKNLFNSATPEQWHKALQYYEHAIAAVSKQKKKPELIALDKWLQESFAEQVKCHGDVMNHKQLSDAMRWKLTRGKMRPLQKLVESNSDESVQSASKRSFSEAKAGYWKRALQSLMALRGVGPATASAILAPLFPKILPFMSDECLEAARPGGCRDYTIMAYEEMRDELVSKAASIGADWTAEQVGKAVWATSVLRLSLADLSDASPPVECHPLVDLPPSLEETKAVNGEQSASRAAIQRSQSALEREHRYLKRLRRPESEGVAEESGTSRVVEIRKKPLVM